MNMLFFHFTWLIRAEKENEIRLCPGGGLGEPFCSCGCFFLLGVVVHY